MSLMSNFFEKSDLSRNEAENIISDTLQKCDDGELYLENSKSETILLDDNKIKNSSYNSDLEFAEYKSPSSHFCSVSEIMFSASLLDRSDFSKKLLIKDIK